MSDTQSLYDLQHKIADLIRADNIFTLHQELSLKDESMIDTNGESLLYIILNNMGDSVFVKDEDSTVLLVNDAFCEMFELSRREIIGQKLLENVLPHERNAFLEIDRHVLSTGIESINEESLTLRDGITRMISTRKTRFFDDSGKKFLIGVVRDITEEKKAENALKKREAQFKELNATKDTLLSVIAHDLRNPIYNIQLLSKLLLEPIENKNKENTGEYLELIHTTSQNTFTLLDNLLEWTRSQTGQLIYRPHRIHLTQVVKDVIIAADSIAKIKNITLSAKEVPDIEISTDDKILKTVLRNLLSNAIKFTEEGGKVAISAIMKTEQIEIIVSDNGVGISEDKREHLFRSMSSLSSTNTGFGLVICKEFVEKLGGSIWVESELGKGSDFKFTLPVKP